jgi:hypothetical protein
MWQGDFSHSAAGDSKPQHAVPDQEIKETYLVTIYLGGRFWICIMVLYEEMRQDASAKTRSDGRVTYFLASCPRAFSGRNGVVFPGASF